jgi:hypothetical protein
MCNGYDKVPLILGQFLDGYEESFGDEKPDLSLTKLLPCCQK